MGLHPWELAWREGRWQELSPPLPAVLQFMGDFKQQNTKRVLDLGCGAGRHTVALANAGLLVTSLDVSETALGELRDRLDKSALTNVTLVKHDMGRIAFLGRLL